jgi:TolB-like protein
MLIIGRLPFNRQTGKSISEKSIAVLPFENLSEDKANAYFAEGIQDEILTRLSKIVDLKVISRTSTQHYKANCLQQKHANDVLSLSWNHSAS